MSDNERALLCRAVGILEAVAEDGLTPDLKLMSQRLVLEFRENEREKTTA